MSILSDLRVLYHLCLRPVRGDDHRARMESFYSGQAGAYDDFRKRLLQGRQEMCDAVAVDEGAVWVDMGGGTGSNLEYLGDRIQRLRKLYVVDLSGSLLEVAQQRIEQRGWQNAQVAEADATTFRPDEGYADVVTFSYSLTMIPDWFAAIDNALSMLRPGGQIAVVDFYVAHKYPAEQHSRHGWFTRNFWPVWFSSDNVFPASDHLPYLERHFETSCLHERMAKVPYLPLIRAPYYIFVGHPRAADPAEKARNSHTMTTGN